MPKFRKKPVVVDAMAWTGRNVSELAKWAAEVDLRHRQRRNDVPKHGGDIPLPIDVVAEVGGWFRCEIKTLEGVMVARRGDWIICGVNGEFYPCKPDIFGATYEPLAYGPAE